MPVFLSFFKYHSYPLFHTFIDTVLHLSFGKAKRRKTKPSSSPQHSIPTIRSRGSFRPAWDLLLKQPLNARGQTSFTFHCSPFTLHSAMPSHLSSHFQRFSRSTTFLWVPWMPPVFASNSPSAQAFTMPSWMYDTWRRSKRTEVVFFICVPAFSRKPI